MSTTETLTLTEFLLARIAEDAARVTLVETVPPKWTMTVYPHDGERIPVDVPALTPARVLLECEAKRRIVETRPAIDAPGPMLATVHETVRHQREYIWRCLALPYADHPDYDEAWRP